MVKKEYYFVASFAELTLSFWGTLLPFRTGIGDVDLPGIQILYQRLTEKLAK